MRKALFLLVALLFLCLSGCKASEPVQASFPSQTSQTTPTPVQITFPPSAQVIATPTPFPVTNENVFTQLDLDGDGIQDRVEAKCEDKEHTILTIVLSAGWSGKISMPFAPYFSTFSSGDLTGDGADECIARADTGGIGGMGSSCLLVLHWDGEEMLSLTLPYRDKGEGENNWGTGYDFNVDYMDGFRMRITSEKLDTIISIPIEFRPIFLEYGHFGEEGEVLEQASSKADGYCGYHVQRQENGVNTLQLAQYVSNGGHSNEIGFGISTLQWNDDQWKLIEQNFIFDYDLEYWN